MFVESWVESGTDKRYLDLLQNLVDEATCATDLIGILVLGSVARGDALPGADLNVRFLLMQQRAIVSHIETRNSIRIDKQYVDIPLAQGLLERDPLEMYTYLDGHILHDPLGALATLKLMALRRFSHYQLSEQERTRLIAQLQLAHHKLTTALKAGDLSRATYVSSMHTSIILQGIWNANSLPLPPNGALWAHIRDLKHGPTHVETQLRDLFTGDVYRRTTVAMTLIDWSLNHLL